MRPKARRVGLGKSEDEEHAHVCQGKPVVCDVVQHLLEESDSDHEQGEGRDPRYEEGYELAEDEFVQPAKQKMAHWRQAAYGVRRPVGAQE
jgi:hypothetical protein